MRPVFGLIAAGLLGCTSVVLAQPSGPTAASGEPGLRAILALGVDSLGRLRCRADQFCAPATPAERANPPLSLDEARAIVRRGVISGAAVHCALEWRKRNFEPMMAYWRRVKRKNERQMALVGFLHGAGQSMSQNMLGGAPCSDIARGNTDAQVPFRP